MNPPTVFGEILEALASVVADTLSVLPGRTRSTARLWIGLLLFLLLLLGIYAWLG